jgi:phosphoribosylformimino-5-aminoimidazole carboxamide ribotide isomerase
VELYPAIDIRSGRVVRLSQGEATRQTVYGEDPAGVAEAFVAAGARWIHVVDLDRAFEEGDNESAVRRVIQRVSGRAAIQAGGGFRTLALVRRGLDLGLSRVVVGTAAATEPDFLRALVSDVPVERLAVGIDARD